MSYISKAKAHITWNTVNVNGKVKGFYSYATAKGKTKETDSAAQQW